METIICDYGCEQEANYKFKSGKNCCSKSPNSCLGMKKKNSEAMKKCRILKGDKFWAAGHPKAMQGKSPWNKGLDKTDERILEISQKVSKTMKQAYDEGRITGKAGSEEAEIERKNKLSKFAKERNDFGGYVEGSGRGKKGRYNGIWCDSSWELAYVIYNIDHNIKFDRNTNRFTYIFNDKKHKYIPDFIEAGIYIEIKGYITNQWKAKLDQFTEKIKVLYEDDMRIYIDYVIDKYGRDYVKLYDKKDT